MTKSTGKAGSTPTLEFHPADDQGNAIIAPAGEADDLYFTIIGCGSNEKQNELGRLIIAAVNTYTQPAPAAGDGARKAARDQELSAWFNKLPSGGGDYPSKEHWDALQAILARHCPAPGAEGALDKLSHDVIAAIIGRHMPENEPATPLTVQDAAREIRNRIDRALKSTNPKPDSGGKG